MCMPMAVTVAVAVIMPGICGRVFSTDLASRCESTSVRVAVQGTAHHCVVIHHEVACQTSK